MRRRFFEGVRQRKPALGKAHHAEHLQGERPGDTASGQQAFRHPVLDKGHLHLQRDALRTYADEEQLQRAFRHRFHPV